MINVRRSTAIAALAVAMSGLGMSTNFDMLSEYGKADIADAFVKEVSVARLCFVNQRVEDCAYGAWKEKHEDEMVFLRMNAMGFAACRRIFDLVDCVDVHRRWMLSRAAAQDAKDRAEDFNARMKGACRPSLLPDGAPRLAFVRDGVPAGFNIEIPAAYAIDEDEARQISNACFRASCRYARNLAFCVEGASAEQTSTAGLTDAEVRHVEVMRSISKKANSSSPAMKLTIQEATELLYVTALCRKAVSGISEFNEKYADGKWRFISRMPETGCTTEFGRRLYDAAAKAGLIKQGL